jgi:hypothetical protein
LLLEKDLLANFSPVFACFMQIFDLLQFVFKTVVPVLSFLERGDSRSRSHGLSKDDVKYAKTKELRERLLPLVSSGVVQSH